MPSELENYKYQLTQVVDALVKEPDSSDLLQLKNDLEELVKLYTTLDDTERRQVAEESQAGLNPTTNTIKLKYEVGEIVLAKWSDSQFYEALVVTELNHEYEVAFTGVDKLINLQSGDMKKVKDQAGKNPILLASKDIVVGRFKKELPVYKGQFKRKERNYSKQDEVEGKIVNNWKKFDAKVNKKSAINTGKKGMIENKPKQRNSFK